MGKVFVGHDWAVGPWAGSDGGRDVGGLGEGHLGPPLSRRDG